MAVAPHAAQITGRVAAHRGQTRTASPSATAASQSVQRARVPQRRHARSFARPVLFRMHATATPSACVSSAAAPSRASSSENQPVRGSASVRSAITTDGHPARWTARPIVCWSSMRASDAVGQLVTRTLGTSARCARSITTSTADQVGAPSERYRSSSASSTRMPATSGTGANAAVLVPTTTGQPALAASHASASVTAGRPRCARRRVRRAA